MPYFSRSVSASTQNFLSPPLYSNAPCLVWVGNGRDLDRRKRILFHCPPNHRRSFFPTNLCEAGEASIVVATRQNKSIAQAPPPISPEGNYTKSAISRKEQRREVERREMQILPRKAQFGKLRVAHRSFRFRSTVLLCTHIVGNAFSFNFPQLARPSNQLLSKHFSVNNSRRQKGTSPSFFPGKGGRRHN